MRRARTHHLRWAAVLTALALLVGCTGDDPEEQAAVGPPGATADAGSTGLRSPSDAAGGTLRLVAGTPDSLDPARSYFPWVWNIMRLYTRTLVTYSSAPGAAGAELVPDLAAEPGVSSDDGRTWTYTLKPDQRFEDGTVITAQDVKYGIERSFASDVIVGGPTYVVDLLDDPDDVYGGPYTDPTADKLGLASVETPDAFTIVFRLNRPYADFDHILALPSSSPVPRAADTGADYGADPVSSGPYAISGIDPVLGITLERNPQWDPAADEVRSALPERIEIRTGLAQADRTQRVLAGSADLDVMPAGVGDEDLARLRADERLVARSDTAPSTAVRMLALPRSVAPFDDENCRRAVALALDRAALASGEPAATGDAGLAQVQPATRLWPQALPGYDADAAGAAADGPDPDGARSALMDCGQPDGFVTRIATPNEPRPLALARAVAADLAEIGVTAQVVGLDPATYYGTEIGRPANVVGGGYGLLLLAWSGDLPTPATFFPPLVSAVTETGNANFAEAADPGLSELVNTALAAPGAAAADAAWRDLDAALVGGSAYLPLAADRITVLAGERLRNAALHPAYGGYDLVVLGVR